MDSNHKYYIGETYVTKGLKRDKSWEGTICEVIGTTAKKDRYELRVVGHAENADQNEAHEIDYISEFDAGSPLAEYFEPIAFQVETPEPNPNYKPDAQFEELFKC